MRVQHENHEDVSHELGSSPESLADGRILCRLVNSIAAGSVKVINGDESYASQASYCALVPLFNL